MSTLPVQGPAFRGEYGLATLPYGVFSIAAEGARVGVRVGDDVVDLAAVGKVLGHPHADVFAEASLNPLMSLGRLAWPEIRAWVRSLVSGDRHRDLRQRCSFPVAAVRLQLPIEVADYVDFYASESHARNVAKIFRPDSPGLPPNWKHQPIGYHGRAGTVVVSGTDIVRPHGQRRPTRQGGPDFGPTAKLDIECEVGFVVGADSPAGSPVPVSQARDHIFGVVLLNDWSARDIQAWESVPLGPFLGKSFATSISAWVVPLEAFEDSELALPSQDPPVLPYLAGSDHDLFGLDLRLQITVNGHEISSPRFRGMYWSPSQMLAHMTVNGARLRVGDLFGSGTVSADEPDSLGSLLELTWDGTRPSGPGVGALTGFLADDDVVTLTGWAPGAGGEPITLGEVTGRVRPAGERLRRGLT